MSDATVPPTSTTTEADQQRQQEKEAEWTHIQTELAAQLHLPQSELFDLPLPHEEEKAERGDNDISRATASQVCRADPTFVHTDFILPRKEIEAAFDMSLDAKDTTTTHQQHQPHHNALAHETPNFLRQLQHDYQRQQQEQEKGGESPIRPLEHIAGLDISFVPGTNLGVACCVVLRFPSLEVERTYFTHCELKEPYVSGFLAFREVEPVLALFQTYREELLLPRTSVIWQQQQESKKEKSATSALPPIAPQLLFLDGCGVLHPRRCGLASHLGALLNLPTIGISKKMLVVGGLSRDYVAGLFSPLPSPPQAAPAARRKGKREEEEELFRLRPLLTCPPALPAVSAHAPLPPQLYGYALQQTSSLKKCVYVSPGNKVGYALAVALVRCVSRHRIPEPTRQADLRSREYIRQHFGSAEAKK